MGHGHRERNRVQLRYVWQARLHHGYPHLFPYRQGFALHYVDPCLRDGHTALVSLKARHVIRAHLVEPPYVRQFHPSLTYLLHPLRTKEPIMRHALRNARPHHLILALVALVLSVGATLSAVALVPSLIRPAASVEVAEDDPNFDCLVNGNRYCGDPGRAHVMEAWGAWDDTDGWTRLRVPTDRSFSVDYVGWGVHSPNLGPMEAAAPGKDGKWYVFRASFTD